MIEAIDTSGLVCGYRVGSDGKMREIACSDADSAFIEEDSVVWLHFNLADPCARQRIEQNRFIPAEGKALLLGKDTHMRIEVCAGGLGGVVGDVHHERDWEGDEFGILRLYLDNRCLISARSRVLKAMEKLRLEVDGGLEVDTPVIIVTRFLHHVTDALAELLIELTNDVDDLEEQLLVGDIADRVPELARIRRVAVRLRRHMIPQQHALVGLVSRLPSWIDDQGAGKLRAAVERLSALGHDLDLVQERARLLSDQLSGRLMEATNRNLYILSIVTTIFLPMTLVTGIFGMNLGGMPGQAHPAGFWYGMAVMIVLGVVTLYMLRRRRML